MSAEETPNDLPLLVLVPIGGLPSIEMLDRTQKRVGEKRTGARGDDHRGGTGVLDGRVADRGGKGKKETGTRSVEVFHDLDGRTMTIWFGTRGGQ